MYSLFQTLTTRSQKDAHCPIITLAASNGKRNVTVWRPSVRLSVCLSVCISRLFTDLNRAHGAYLT